MAPSGTMRVVVYNQPGDASVLMVEERPIPKRGDGEVLVKQYGTSVNPVDYKMRSSNKEHLPKVPGGDISGIIEEVGSGSKFKKGDGVIGLAPWFWMSFKEGTYAEYVSAKEEWLAYCPKSLPLHEAGQVPLVSLTCWQAMSDWNIRPGSRVLVHAGSSGVGTWVLQTAKLRGAHVVSTAGPKNQEFLKELGADETINYHEHDFADVYKDKPFDYIFDSVGGENTVKGYTKLINKSGAYTEIANTGTDQNRVKEYTEMGKEGKGAKYKFMIVEPNGKWMQEIADLIEQGKLKCIKDRTYDLFTQVREAHEFQETGRARGKVILEIVKE
ncbi:TPA: hypothetical protein ACH3X3_001675 [Trebouxia sp. C0006]